MPIIPFANVPSEDAYPGVPRSVLVDARQGAQSLNVGHLTIGVGNSITTHIHPDTEETMVIVEGTLESILGDEVVTVGPGDAVVAPAGIKHGFVNRSSAPARILAIFPKTEFERVLVD